MRRGAGVRPGRSRRRRWTRLAILLTGILLGAALLLSLSTCHPRWYEPAAIDHARLPMDKQTLVAMVDGIGAALNEGRETQLTLREGQVNRWLAARHALWPDAVVDFGGLDHPQVRFMPGRIRAAARIRMGGWRSVVSLTCAVTTAPTGIEIVVEEVRLGALPMPRGWLVRRLAELPAAARSMESDAGAGIIRLKRTGVWSNGKRPFHIRTLDVQAGAVHIGLEPTDERPTEAGVSRHRN
jgi:hypothetical protein